MCGLRIEDESRLDTKTTAVHGLPIGPNDLLIAATARGYDLVLVTHNTGQFSRVAGLKLEDWESRAFHARLELPNLRKGICSSALALTPKSRP
jgi:hypothetical protein